MVGFWFKLAHSNVFREVLKISKVYTTSVLFFHPYQWGRTLLKKVARFYCEASHTLKEGLPLELEIRRHVT